MDFGDMISALLALAERNEDKQVARLLRRLEIQHRRLIAKYEALAEKSQEQGAVIASQQAQMIDQLKTITERLSIEVVEEVRSNTTDEELVEIHVTVKDTRPVPEIVFPAYEPPRQLTELVRQFERFNAVQKEQWAGLNQALSVAEVIGSQFSEMQLGTNAVFADLQRRIAPNHLKEFVDAFRGLTSNSAAATAIAQWKDTDSRATSAIAQWNAAQASRMAELGGINQSTLAAFNRRVAESLPKTRGDSQDEGNDA
jgi:hypothetical protein